MLDGLHEPERLSHVFDEVELMERLLEDLRVLTLAEAGRLRLHKETTDIEDVIGDVIASFARPREAGRGRGHRAEPGLPELEADPHRLRQVLANLVSNAAAQMPEGGTLRVEAGREDGFLVVVVKDTGPGIPEDRLERVFERFVKAGDSRGTGLGPSIACDLVEAHGGSLHAANRARAGAVFIVRLPL